MFQSIYSLTRKYKNSKRNFLEDYNTECFAALLSLSSDLLEVFVQFLELPHDNYKVVTQLKAHLVDDVDCIVDLALVGESTICLIENKVESGEGWRQLTRYAKVLDGHYANHQNRYLVYCTKYSEDKEHSDVFLKEERGVKIPFGEDIVFSNIRWYQIAKLLQLFTDNPFINNYLSFLHNHGMAQDNTIRIEHLLSASNFKKTTEVFRFYLDNSFYDFSKTFKVLGSVSKGDKNYLWGQLTEHNRFAYFISHVLKDRDTNKWSEVLYSIEFATMSLRVQVFVNLSHPQYDSFIKTYHNRNTEQFQDLGCDNFEGLGTAIYLEQPLGDYLNHESADLKIKAWYASAFSIINNFINASNDLEWNKVG